MLFYSILFFVLSVINFSLAFFVLYKNPKAKINRIFCVFGISVALWGFGGFAIGIAPDRTYAIRSLFILNLGQVFIYSTFYHFVLVLTLNKKRINKILLYLAYISSLTFLIIDRFFGLVNKDVVKVFGFYYPIGGIGSWFFAPFLLFFMSYSIRLLYQKHKTSKSFLEKNRIRYIFFGASLAIIGAIPNILLVYGIKVYPTGNISAVIFNFTIAYAIFKYRLMDIKIIIRKGLIYSLLTILITSIWLINIFLLQKLFKYITGLETAISSILTLAIITFFFQALRDWIQYFVDRLFFKKSYLKEDLYNIISKEIASSIDKDVFLSSILKIIYQTFQPFLLKAILLDKEEKIFKEEFSLGEDISIPQFKFDEPIILWLKENKRELLKEDVERGNYPLKNGLLENFKMMSAEMVVPLIFENEILGFLIFGERYGNNVYDYSDISFLIGISHEIAIAINNANVYTNLKKRTNELEIANRAKSDFLSLVSHELKTPLTDIIANLYLFKTKRMGDINQRQMDGILTMEERTNNLKNLINDIVDLSLLEKGRKLAFEIKDVDISSLVNGIIKDMIPQAEKKGIEIITSIPDSLIIQYDEGRIKKVFANLIENAIKFNRENGKIDIAIKEYDNFIEGSIEDTGIGIPDDKKDKIFERFYQIDTSDRRTYEGTGLGLSIAKEIIEGLGGKIWVEGEVGKGSKFIFTILKKR
ncbi:MAG: ATP-binding protein [bacterium]